MKAIVVGILPQELIRERMLAIARGEFKPKPTEPKIWFTSMRSLAEALSDENRALLKVIQEAKPRSNLRWQTSQGANQAICREHSKQCRITVL